MKRSKIVDEGERMCVVPVKGECASCFLSDDSRCCAYDVVELSTPGRHHSRYLCSLAHMVRHSDLELDRTARRIVMGEPLLFRAT